MNVTLKVDTREFERTRKLYMRQTRRDLTDILNTKAFFIARGAVRETPRVQPGRLSMEFGEARSIRPSKRPRAGKAFIVGKPILTAKIGDMVRLAVIINARRAKAGKPGLQGKEMEKAVSKVYGARMRSLAFMASGWLDAVATLDLITSDRRGAPPRDSSVKRVGRMKGGATPARDSGWNQTATIWNTASTTRDKKAALHTYGIPALQRAVNAEVRSMKDYIERKLKERLQKSGIKFL